MRTELTDYHLSSLTGLAPPGPTEGGHGRLAAVSSDDAEPVRGAVQGETVEVQSDETNPLHHLEDVAAQGASLGQTRVLLVLKTNQTVFVSKLP